MTYNSTRQTQEPQKSFFKSFNDSYLNGTPLEKIFYGIMIIAGFLFVYLILTPYFYILDNIPKVLKKFGYVNEREAKYIADNDIETMMNLQTMSYKGIIDDLEKKLHELQKESASKYSIEEFINPPYLKRSSPLLNAIRDQPLANAIKKWVEEGYQRCIKESNSDAKNLEQKHQSELSKLKYEHKIDLENVRYDAMNTNKKHIEDLEMKHNEEIASLIRKHEQEKNYIISSYEDQAKREIASRISLEFGNDSPLTKFDYESDKLRREREEREEAERKRQKELEKKEEDLKRREHLHAVDEKIKEMDKKNYEQEIKNNAHLNAVKSENADIVDKFREHKFDTEKSIGNLATNIDRVASESKEDTKDLKNRLDRENKDRDHQEYVIRRDFKDGIAEQGRRIDKQEDDRRHWEANFNKDFELFKGETRKWLGEESIAHSKNFDLIIKQLEKFMRDSDKLGLDFEKNLLESNFALQQANSLITNFKMFLDNQKGAFLNEANRLGLEKDRVTGFLKEIDTKSREYSDNLKSKIKHYESDQENAGMKGEMDYQKKEIAKYKLKELETKISDLEFQMGQYDPENKAHKEHVRSLNMKLASYLKERDRLVSIIDTPGIYSV